MVGTVLLLPRDPALAKTLAEQVAVSGRSPISSQKASYAARNCDDRVLHVLVERYLRVACSTAATRPSPSRCHARQPRTAHARIPGTATAMAESRHGALLDPARESLLERLEPATVNLPAL